jgi:hypothetical protein
MLEDVLSSRVRNCILNSKPVIHSIGWTPLGLGLSGSKFIKYKINFPETQTLLKNIIKKTISCLRTNPSRLRCYPASFPQHIAPILFIGSSSYLETYSTQTHLTHPREQWLDLNRSAARISKTLSADGRHDVKQLYTLNFMLAYHAQLSGDHNSSILSLWLALSYIRLPTSYLDAIVRREELTWNCKQQLLSLNLLVLTMGSL